MKVEMFLTSSVPGKKHFLTSIIYTASLSYRRHSVCVLSRFSRVRLRDTMDCSPPGSTVHEILQATTLEWVAISSSRGSSRSRDRNWVSCVGRWVLYH